MLMSRLKQITASSHLNEKLLHDHLFLQCAQDGKNDMRLRFKDKD